MALNRGCKLTKNVSKPGHNPCHGDPTKHTRFLLDMILEEGCNRSLARGMVTASTTPALQISE
ncbi:hypothetical protein A6R68_19645, partial [Neotoma lepida]